MAGARSPETNLLDLGIWMPIQATVHNIHHHQKRIQHDSLANSVETAWEGNLNEVAFSNIYNRLRITLSLILRDGGGNDKVEEKRGEKFKQDFTESDEFKTHLNTNK